MHFKKKKKKENTDAYTGQCFLALSKCTLFFEKRVSAKPMHFQQVMCTVHGTHKPFFSSKLSLKMGLTALFTYLTIILLQYFQFLVFRKIRSIQTRLQSMHVFGLRFWCCVCVFLLLLFYFFIFIFFIEKCISCGILSISGSCALCTGPTTSLSSKILTRMCLSVSPMHYSQDPQTFF